MADDQPMERSSPPAHPPAPPPASMRRTALAPYRFVWLFAGLVVYLGFVPIVQHLRDIVKPTVAELVQSIVLVLLLFAVAMSSSRSWRWKLFTILLGLPTVLLWALPLAEVPDSLRLVRHVFAGSFIAFGIVGILQAIFASREVNFDLLCASLCVYLLMGVLWAIIFSLIATVNPNAFHVSGAQSATGLRMDTGHPSEALYYSYSTLTTLGYGDIVPTAPETRLLAAIEAILGQLYLAVLVARLVGLHIVESVNRMNSDAVKP